jgi:uncharacterized protein YndB with AHSA1/START domain
MANAGRERIDTASRVIRASAQSIYEAFIHPDALTKWLPPQGMRGIVHAFSAQQGGKIHMSLVYVDSNHELRGKTTDDADVFRGTFLELVPQERIVHTVEFDSEDPAFAGIMKMTWLLKPAGEGTEVTVICENVPSGIRKEDHDAGLKSSLANLAMLVESIRKD